MTIKTIYGINISESSIDDIMNFDYRNYMINELLRSNCYLHISILDFEYKHANYKFILFTNEYKRLTRLGEETIEIKKARLHYFNMCKELRSMMVDLQNNNMEDIA